MTDDEAARRGRADELRRKIRDLEKDSEGAEDDPVESTPDILPGESPNDYVQRRMREIDSKQPPA